MFREICGAARSASTPPDFFRDRAGSQKFVANIRPPVKIREDLPAGMLGGKRPVDTLGIFAQETNDLTTAFHFRGGQFQPALAVRAA